MICNRGYPRLLRNKNVSFVRLKYTKKELVLQVNEGSIEFNDGGEGGHNDRQDNDEVELTPMDFDASRNGDAVNDVDDIVNGVDDASNGVDVNDGDA
ncbi:unnamed protein product [Lactuca saligna]|uniref:Uncharacterized protein n=1 Tax=Lactuca saligna TaxID=75948 RepID=A0AA36EAJ0_LACSI|nr:unnamed protein product [Lactuca saligna]